MARDIDLIVIHCSDSPNGRTLFTGKPGDKNFTTPVQEIDRWHQERGFARADWWRLRHNPQLTSIGYHYVIYTLGAIASGRHEGEIGAHVQGHNARSIGICLVGKDAFTQAQWIALTQLVEQLKKRYPTARVAAHHDLNPDKTCPNFDVAAWLSGGMKPVSGQTFVDPIEGEKA